MPQVVVHSSMSVFNPKTCVYIKMKVGKQFIFIFINVALILIGYRKLDYCFITSTSLFPVTVSIQI